jgi:excisionase family DNA binding protein
VSQTSLDARHWLSQAESAEYLGVTARTIRAYIDRGALTGHRVHGSRLVRIDRAELDAMLRPILPRSGGGVDDGLQALATYIERVVSSAPALDDDQRERLTRLLRPALASVGGPNAAA